MHVLYIHQYFITPNRQGGTRSYEFARYLVEHGHSVTMVTSGLMNPEFPVRDGETFSSYQHEGIDIVSVRGGYNDALAGTGFGGLQRMLKFREFARVAVRIAKTLPRPDLVFATHTPLTVGLAGKSLKRHFDVPFVFEVRDLWPDALINIGALSNPVVIAYLRWMERRSYRAADHIVALSPGMKAGVCRQGIPDEKVTVIPNSSDLDLFHPGLDGSAERERLGIDNRFAAIYFGAVGLANGLDYVLDAAAILKQRGHDHIVILIVGSGGHKEKLVARAKAAQLDNVIFHHAIPKRQVAHVVAGCDACLTIFRATKETTWSPNKMFDALSAGKPVLINVGDWLGDTIESNQCGHHVSAHDPTSLADTLESLALDPGKCKEMGRNSRALAEREFDRNKLAAKLTAIFTYVTHARSQLDYKGQR